MIYLILYWGIASSSIAGPFNDKADAERIAAEDVKDAEGMDHWAVLGPFPVSAVSPDMAGQMPLAALAGYSGQPFDRDVSNPLFASFTEHFRPSELEALLVECRRCREDDIDAAKIRLLEACLENMGHEPSASDGDGPAGAEAIGGALKGWQALGMQWLVFGLSPDVRWLSGHATRREALEALEDSPAGKSFEHFAIIKARDLFCTPD